MRTSLSRRAAAALAASLLLLSPGLEAAFAHGQASFGAPGLRSGFVHNRGFAPGFRNAGRQSWSWRGPYGGNRYGRSGRFWNQGFYGGFYGPGFWYPTYGYGGPGPAGEGGGPVVIVVGAPSFNDLAAAPNEGANLGPQGGCVIHKLSYDRTGAYLGDRRTSEC
jgi:hypothetical protein